MVLAVIILFVSYVLSIGPLIFILAALGLPWDHPIYAAIPTIYAPVYWICENSELAASFSDWYLNLWGELVYHFVD